MVGSAGGIDCDDIVASKNMNGRGCDGIITGGALIGPASGEGAEKSLSVDIVMSTGVIRPSGEDSDSKDEYWRGGGCEEARGASNEAKEGGVGERVEGKVA